MHHVVRQHNPHSTNQLHAPHSSHQRLLQPGLGVSDEDTNFYFGEPPEGEHMYVSRSSCLISPSSFSRAAKDYLPTQQRHRRAVTSAVSLSSLLLFRTHPNDTSVDPAKAVVVVGATRAVRGALGIPCVDMSPSQNPRCEVRVVRVASFLEKSCPLSWSENLASSSREPKKQPEKNKEACVWVDSWLFCCALFALVLIKSLSL